MTEKGEVSQPKYRVLRFEFEGWERPDSQEFQERFFAFLEENGFDPEQLVFRGFDGSSIKERKPLSRVPGIYAMNANGWRESVRSGADPPPVYAMDEGVRGYPCIGLYQSAELREANFYETEPKKEVELGEAATRKMLSGGEPVKAWDDEDEPNIEGFTHSPYLELVGEKRRIVSIVVREPLAEMPPDFVLVEGVTHINYPKDPKAAPNDALVGAVFLEEVDYRPS